MFTTSFLANQKRTQNLQHFVLLQMIKASIRISKQAQLNKFFMAEGQWLENAEGLPHGFWLGI
jgi:hypothetical protein